MKNSLLKIANSKSLSKWLIVLACVIACASIFVGITQITADAVIVVTVSFDMQGHGNQVDEETVAGGGKVTMPAPDPDATGYSFEGWFKEAACSNAWDFDTDTANTDTTIFAKWIPVSYSITFDTNGGDLEPGYTAPNVYTIEDEVTLPTSSLVSKTNFTFVGWYDNEELLGSPVTTIPAGTTGDKYFYACWAIGITFDMQGYGTQVEPQTVAPGSKVEKPDNPSATSYTFKGWFKEAACSNAWNFNTDTVSKNTTLFAKWEPKTTAVTFDANGGTAGNKTSETATYDSAMPALTAQGNLPTMLGYDFTGYFDAATGGVKYYNADGTSAKNWNKDAATATLYAQWTPKSTTVSLDANGGTAGNKTSETATYDSAMPALTAQGNLPTKPGYSFAGYFDAATSGTKYYNADGTGAKNWDKDAATATLYAQWTPNTNTAYTVQHYQQKVDGTGYDLKDTDNECGTTATQTVAQAKEYEGFTNQQFSQETILGDGSTNVIIYYDRIVYDVTFVSDGETYTTEKARYGALVTKPNDPGKKHYNFVAWFAKNAQGQEVPFDFDSNTVPGDITIVAKWQIKPEYVAFLETKDKEIEKLEATADFQGIIAKAIDKINDLEYDDELSLEANKKVVMRIAQKAMRDKQRAYDKELKKDAKKFKEEIDEATNGRISNFDKMIKMINLRVGRLTTNIIQGFFDKVWMGIEKIVSIF